MIGYPRDVKAGNWVRVGESKLWRTVTSIKRGKELTKFTLEGAIPVWVVPTADAIWWEDRAGFARNKRGTK